MLQSWLAWEALGLGATSAPVLAPLHVAHSFAGRDDLGVPLGLS